MLIKSDILLILILSCLLLQVHPTTYPVYASSCDSQSSNRTCEQDGNVTEYLLNIKKGGTNILSTSDYQKNFFECQEYTFDCGYVQSQQQTVSIANGIELDLTDSEIDTILPTNTTLAQKLKSYSNLTASDAKCGMKVFPLTLTSDESNLFFDNYMTKLLNQIKTKYDSQKLNDTKLWSSININIKTALSMVLKQNRSLMNSSFWNYLIQNDFRSMSNYLKDQYRNTNNLEFLHSSYLIDSVTVKCNKRQSVNFLVDQSGSITAAPFQLALDFLRDYVTQTNDDPGLISIHFYSTAFQPYLGFNHTKAQLLSGIANKTYPGGGTNTGLAINETIKLIDAANFDKGLNKVLIIMTDGFSNDNVLLASNLARSKDITVISMGIGPNVNDVQLLQMAQTPSNIIKASSYSDLQKLIDFISNYFCKQIINLKINQTIYGNDVRVPESPAFFRVEKSNASRYYQLTISYEQDPELKQQALYSSEYDPFPDQFTEFSIKQLYRPSITTKVYYISPTSNVPIRVKKNFYQDQDITSSYVSVGGNNLKFNITLTPCATLNCTVQRTKHDQYFKKKDSTPTSDKDYDIYMILGASVAGLVCAAAMGIFTLRKIFGGEQELADELDRIKPQMTQQDFNINDNDNLNQKLSIKSIQSKNSHKSQKNRNNSSDSKKSDDSCNIKAKRSQSSQQQYFD